MYRKNDMRTFWDVLIFHWIFCKQEHERMWTTTTKHIRHITRWKIINKIRNMWVCVWMSLQLPMQKQREKKSITCTIKHGRRTFIYETCSLHRVKSIMEILCDQINTEISEHTNFQRNKNVPISISIFWLFLSLTWHTYSIQRVKIICNQKPKNIYAIGMLQSFLFHIAFISLLTLFCAIFKNVFSSMFTIIRKHIYY